MGNAYRVFVVLDPNFGERLAGLSESGPVWIVESEPNCAAAHRVWDKHIHSSHLDGVTTFKAIAGLSREDALVDELGTIDLHHGAYSPDNSYETRGHWCDTQRGRSLCTI